MPSKGGAEAVARCFDVSGVTRPSIGELDLEVGAGHPLHGLDHFEYRKAAAITAIERCRHAAAAQIRQSVGMCAHQIGHVNIIADASAVRRRIVCAEDFDFWSPSERRFDTDFDEVRGTLVEWPVRPSGSAPATLK